MKSLFYFVRPSFCDISKLQALLLWSINIWMGIKSEIITFPELHMESVTNSNFTRRKRSKVFSLKSEK